ncbi:hypothetical protein EU528_04635 [Candidatus Thorarchaeota archaeon]|nr:MAG: hypothetical protein EU528_04635 [Candidatus Thorarchaeota archaeon]
MNVEGPAILDEIDIITILLGFSLIFLLFFIEALISADSSIIEKNMFLWKAYTKNPRRFSLACAIAAAIGIAMLILPAISFLFENSMVFGMSAIVMLFIGVLAGPYRTYHVLMNLSSSTN